MISQPQKYKKIRNNIEQPQIQSQKEQFVLKISLYCAVILAIFGDCMRCEKAVPLHCFCKVSLLYEKSPSIKPRGIETKCYYALLYGCVFGICDSLGAGGRWRQWRKHAGACAR